MTRLACLIVAVLLAAGPASAFEVNGRHWPSMPIHYAINLSSAPDFGAAVTAADLVAQAVAAWSSVPCAEVSFAYDGDTTATWEHDGKNTIFWVSDSWQFGEAAAGATLWLPTADGEMPEVDLALNAVAFQWVPGGGDALTPSVVDPASVIAHELGHWLGLSHSADQFATMYQALLPGDIQATLEADDKFGICTLYPGGDNECDTKADCPIGQTCRSFEALKACGDEHDPPGAKCSKTHLDCEGMCFISFYECTSLCLFTSLDYKQGYCAPLCVDSPACPDGWTCVPVPKYGISVCQIGVSDPGPEPIADLPPEPEPEPVPEPVPEPESEPGPEPAPENAGVDAADEPDTQVSADPAPEAEIAGPSTSGKGCAAGSAPVPLLIPVVFLGIGIALAFYAVRKAV